MVKVGGEGMHYITRNTERRDPTALIFWGQSLILRLDLGLGYGWVGVMSNIRLSP